MPMGREFDMHAIFTGMVAWDAALHKQLGYWRRIICATVCSLMSACSHMPPPSAPPETVPTVQAQLTPRGVALAPFHTLISQGDARPNANAPAVQGVAPSARKVQPDGPPLDLWDRLRQGFALPALEGEAAQRAEAAAQRHAQSGLLQRSASRAQIYLYPFVAEAEKRGLPLELALLPYVESALNPHARSPVGAVGACQFMPATGKRFELAQSAWVDQRRDVLRCANAMLDYLSENHARFGSWHLALAAYNWGEGAVGRAVDKNRKANLPAAYEALSMPRETQNYVPALLGLAAVVADPGRYGVILPALPNVPPWVEVALPADMDVQRVLQLASVSHAEFDRLNPAILRPVIPKAVHSSIVLPPPAAERFVKALAQQRSHKAMPLASWGALRVQRTERLTHMAKRLGCAAETLAQANSIPLNHMVLAGSVLAVPKTSPRDIDEHSASEGVVRTALPPARPKRKPQTRRAPARSYAKQV